MFANYIKIAFRNLWKHKVYSLINISGLAIGIACCFLILLYIQHELSYDRYNQNIERMYRLIETFQLSSGEDQYPSASFPVAAALNEHFGEDITVTRFYKVFKQTPYLSYGENRFYESKFFFADSTVFDIFTFEFIEGNPQTALKQPYSIVITEDMAQKYFQGEPALGKLIRFEGELDYKVTGVIKNVPENSHLTFDFLAAMMDMETVFKLTDTPVDWLNSMYWNPCYTYLLLKEGVLQQSIDTQFPEFVNKYFPEYIRDKISFHLEPLADTHLYTDTDESIAQHGDIVYIYIFGLIAAFILLIACINFMNLSTARSAMRAKEVGLRKVLGAFRGQLIRQFLGEAIVLSILATIISIVLIEMFLPQFNAIAGKQITLDYLGNDLFILGLFAVAFSVGIIAGSYPAFFLSAFKPVSVLKGGRSTGAIGRSPLLRKGLVVLQFSISIILIIATIIVFQQLHFLRNNQLGFDKAHTVVFSLRGTDFREHPLALKNKLLTHSAISGVTVSSDVPGPLIHFYPFRPEGSDETIDLPAYYVDHDFIKTMDINLLQGRDFSSDIASDTTEAFIINETAMKRFGWTEAAGKGFQFGSNRKGQVIGVIEDINYGSLKDLAGPLVLHIWPQWYEFLFVKVTPGNMAETLPFIEKTWTTFTNGRPLNYFFLDENLNKMYRPEEQLSNIFGYFSGLAILIACLGLFGLASFSAERRIKEIGIRKVLGASVSNVVLLLSKEFTLLVLIANIVAWPLAYFSMNFWLQDFAYRVDIGWWVFALAGGLALLIAILTVSSHAIKTALTNPVEALRYE